jgi:hypothetical protein
MSKWENLCIKAYLNLRRKTYLKGDGVLCANLKGSKLNLVMRMNSPWLRWSFLEFLLILRGNVVIVVLIMLILFLLLIIW